MRRRVLLAVLLTTTLAVVAFFLPASIAIHRAQKRGEFVELERELFAAARGLENLPVNGNQQLQAILDAKHPIAIYSARGQLLLGDGPADPDAMTRLAMTGRFAEGHIGGDVVAAIPVSETPAHPALVVRIEAPKSESQARYYRSLALLGGAALVILTVAAAVGVLVANRLNRPIDELKEWADSPNRGEPPPEPTGIEELDSLRSALLDNHTRIEELLARERSFSSQVSHQLRTPVAAMRVAVETELAAPRPDTSAVLHESLGQLDRLESTISSLLALARHTDRTRVECNVLALCRDNAAHWRDAVERDGRRLLVEGDGVTARVDADALRHVLDVLIDNALHHGKGDINVVAHGGDGAIAIDISDEGPAPLDRDPFADTGSVSAHGIGLRLARTLTESSQGRLELVDTENTTYRVTVPV
jgi:signal transduction histidine kinase